MFTCVHFSNDAVHESERIFLVQF